MIFHGETDHQRKVFLHELKYHMARLNILFQNIVSRNKKGIDKRLKEKLNIKMSDIDM